jgi:hypothetical protein
MYYSYVNVTYRCVFLNKVALRVKVHRMRFQVKGILLAHNRLLG